MTGRLSVSEKTILIGLSDPRRLPPAALGVGAASLVRLIDVAESHGVGAIVWRKLLKTDLGAARGDSDLRARLAEVQDRITVAAGQSLLLAHTARRLADALRAEKVDFAILKGPVFARRLYTESADRPFTDIDVLAERSHLDRANAVLAAQGFVLARKAVWDNSDRNLEYKWTVAGNDTLLVEVHGNLVHYPRLRSRRSFGYGELMTISNDAEDPASLLTVAIVHASLGHKFNSLRLVIDVLQAARGLAAEDYGRFVKVVDELGLGFEAQAALDLAARMYDDEAARNLAGLFRRGRRSSLAARLLTPDMVIEGAFGGSFSARMRRRGFRLLQHIGPA